MERKAIDDSRLFPPATQLFAKLAAKVATATALSGSVRSLFHGETAHCRRRLVNDVTLRRKIGNMLLSANTT